MVDSNHCDQAVVFAHFKEMRVAPLAVKKIAEVFGFRVDHAAIRVARINVGLIELKMLVTVIGFDNVCGQILIVLQAASLAAVWSEGVHGESTGLAFGTAIAMRTIGEISTATITQLDKLAVKLHIHLPGWIRNKVGGHTVRQITTVMLGREIQMNVL